MPAEFLSLGVRARGLRRSLPSAPAMLLAVIVVAACGAPPQDSGAPPAATSSAAASSVPSMAAMPSPATRQPSPTPDEMAEGMVAWEVETTPVPDGRDAADDPAIWLNPDDPAGSLILGTNKKGDRGLLVYDLAGQELFAYDGGAMNNVDLRRDVAVGDRSVVLVVASMVEGRALVMLELDTGTGELLPISGGTVETGIRSSGLCLWRPRDGGVHAFATAGDGRVHQWALVDGEGMLDPTLVRELAVESRVEGCVADDETGDLFFAEEAVGVWRVSADPDSPDEPELVDEVGGASGLAPDVEGMAIARYEDGRRYLIVSSQGNDRFIAYRLDDDGGVEAVGDVRIGDPDGEDNVEHTDGVEVVVADFGQGPFAGGLMVVQDDDNEQPGGDEANQNFKLVPWDAVEANLALE